MIRALTEACARESGCQGDGGWYFLLSVISAGGRLGIGDIWTNTAIKRATKKPRRSAPGLLHSFNALGP